MVVEVVAFWVVAGVGIAGVYIVLTKVGVRLTRVARGRAVLLDDPLHSVSEPPRQRERGDSPTDLILWVRRVVVPVRGVAAVGQDAIDR
jgi:hypothetical protein